MSLTQHTPETLSQRIRKGNSTPQEDRVADAAMDLLVALADVLRSCVTVKGLPDKGKGRTSEQQAAMDKAHAAFAKAGIS